MLCCAPSPRRCSNVTLGDTLHSLNLTLAAQPHIVPFKVSAVMHLSSDQAAPRLCAAMPNSTRSSRRQCCTASPWQPARRGAVVFLSTHGALHTHGLCLQDGKVLVLPPPALPPPKPAMPPPRPAPPSAPVGGVASSPANATESSDSGGLPKWAAVEIAVFISCGVLVALGALAGVVYWRRRVGRRRRAAAAAAPSTVPCTPPAPASDGDSPADKDAKQEGPAELPQHTTITLSATAS